MAGLRIKGFAGEQPRAHPMHLPPNAAQIAQNVRLNNGALAPLRGTTVKQAKTIIGTPLSIFRYAPTTWLEWAVDVDVQSSPLPNDTFGRVYYTGDAEPKVSYNTIITSGAAPYPANSYTLGIPAPASAVTLAINGVATDPTDIPDTRYYVVTYVDVFGEEGPPSPPSLPIDVMPGQTVDISGIPTVWSGAGTYNLAFKRLYRTNTGSLGTDYQYVMDIPLADDGTVPVNDAVLSGDLAEVLATTTYDLPPTGLKGLTKMPGGFFVGYYANILCFSEPGAPHAWPIAYQLTAGTDIQGIAVFGNTVVVTTNDLLYIASGILPESMLLTKMEMFQAGVSKRGVVDMGTSVVYPSPDGLVLANSSGVVLITKDIFTRDEWQALVPTSIHAYLWEGRYLGFYDTGAAQGAFSIDPAHPENGVLFYDVYATAGYHDASEDILYLVVGSNIVSWNTGTVLTYLWKSKKFVIPHHTNYSAVQVTADTYPVTFELFADGVSVAREIIESDEAVRLPGGYKERIFEIQLSGVNPVFEVIVVDNINNLKAA